VGADLIRVGKMDFERFSCLEKLPGRRVFHEETVTILQLEATHGLIRSQVALHGGPETAEYRFVQEGGVWIRLWSLEARARDNYVTRWRRRARVTERLALPACVPVLVPSEARHRG
jgi:hypothetical protein